MTHTLFQRHPLVAAATEDRLAEIPSAIPKGVVIWFGSILSRS